LYAYVKIFSQQLFFALRHSGKREDFKQDLHPVFSSIEFMRIGCMRWMVLTVLIKSLRITISEQDQPNAAYSNFGIITYKMRAFRTNSFAIPGFLSFLFLR